MNTAKQKSPHHYKLENLQILVVDDSRSMRSLVIEILRELGVGRVNYAPDGASAMKMIDPQSNRSSGFEETFSFDIIISDWMMEPVSGIELLKWIRAHKVESIRYTPFIMLTGYSDQKRIFEARDAGITEFLAKPISVKSLTEHLLTVIDRPRKFIISEKFMGPDRRRRVAPIDFPDRRTTAKKDGE
ncbi:MAG: response regulator [Alphaproteobacteria bacterium]|nr:MAG: response regulator [Alphaproteobacteria bacterium]